MYGRRSVDDTKTRAVAAVSAITWFVVPGFGLIDLSVTWDADWPQALEAGWGLFSTVVVGAAFALVSLRPRSVKVVRWQLAVAILALAVSTAAAGEGRLFWLAVVLALQTVLVGAVARGSNGGAEAQIARSRPSRSLVALACVGVGPWLVYALHMWALNRRGEPGDVSIGIDHYAMQGALGLALALIPGVVAVRREQPAFAAACVGVAATYLGLVSLRRPEALAGFTRFWSIAAVAWGLALVVSTLRSARVAAAPSRS